MDILNIMYDLYKDEKRQGPGSDETTLEALKNIPNYKNLKNILNIGCGTGAETLVLAGNTNASITAIDLSTEFLSILDKKAISNKVDNKTKTMNMSMDDLKLKKHSYDLIWSEGAIYHIGFKSGLSYWKEFIDSKGYLVVSEICWLTKDRPQEIEDYWRYNYSEIATIDDKLDVIKECGLDCLNYFTLQEKAWTENYYIPIIKKIDNFAKLYKNNPDVLDFIEGTLNEYKLYTKYKDYYSYVFFILKK